MKARTALGVAASGALVSLGSFGVLARADVTPITMPTKPTVPSMNLGQTVKPTTTDDDGMTHMAETTLSTASFAPVTTAVPFGGELG